MATAAQMLIGSNQPGATSASGGAAAGTSHAARSTRGASGVNGLDTMENFASALRASTSAQPFGAGNLMANGSAATGNGTQGIENGDGKATPLANLLANLPGFAGRLDENGNLVPAQAGTSSNALLSGIFAPGNAAHLAAGSDKTAGTVTLGAGFEARLAQLTGGISPFGANGEAGAPAGNTSNIAQLIAQLKGMGINLGLGTDQTPEQAQNASLTMNTDADSATGEAGHAAAAALSTLLSQVEAGNLQLPAAAQSVLENGGTLAEFRQALLDGGANFGAANVEINPYAQLEGFEHLADFLQNGELNLTGDTINRGDLAAGIGEGNGLGLGQESGLGDGVLAGLNREGAGIELAQLAGVSRLELAPEVRAALANGTLGNIHGNAQTNAPANGQAIGQVTSNLQSAASGSNPLAGLASPSPEGRAAAPTTAGIIASAGTPNAATPAAVANAGAPNAVTPVASAATGTPTAAIAPQGSEALTPKAAPLHRGAALQKNDLGQLIQQVRSGEISPEAAREALVQSGRGHLADRLPLTQMAGLKGAPSTINTAAQNVGFQNLGNTPGTTPDVGATKNFSETKSQAAAPQTPPLAERVTERMAKPAVNAPAANPATTNLGAARGIVAGLANDQASNLGTTKAQALLNTAQASSAEAKSPVEASFAKAQNGDVPNERPVQAKAGHAKTQATMIKEAATQFRKSDANPAAAVTVSNNAAAQPATPGFTAPAQSGTAAPAAHASQADAVIANAPLPQNLDVVQQQAARGAADGPAEFRVAERAATPAPLTTPQTSEAAPMQHRPEASHDRNVELRSAMRFDTATRAAAVQDMSVALTRFAGQGLSRFQIRLDPSELGKVEVKLDIGTDGKTTAHITVERPETLDMMRNDARSLERALQDAGLKTDQNSMSFSLKDQDENARESGDRDGLSEWAQDGKKDEALNEETIQLTASMDETIGGLRIMGARGIDVRI